MSPASSKYRETLAPSDSADDEHPPADPSIASNLPLPLALKSAFQASLEEHNVTLRFFSGSWEGFDPSPFDLVLTSETIYRPDGLLPLIRLMRAAAGPSLEELAEQKLALDSRGSDEPKARPSVCLVAAKVLYFGVGGGVSDFVRAVESTGKGRVTTVWQKKDGVGRRVMQVEWLDSE